MHVASLRLREFRNYERAELHLEPGAHVFVGANGQGKTNLVEAIGYLAHGRSHRVSSDEALVRRGADRALVQAELAHGSRRLPIEVSIARAGANQAQVSGRRVRTRELSRYIATVLFAPEDLALVRGEPGQRRTFLDELLGLHSIRVARRIADYERVVRQRNALLRSLRGDRRGSAAESSLEVWDEQLVELGSEVTVERLRLIARLEPHVRAAYARLVGGDHGVGLQLRVSALGQSATVRVDDEEDDGVVVGEVDLAEVRERFVQRVRGSRERELDRGVSLVGPHRDDAHFTLNGLPARQTASHGESWSFALALKLASAALVRDESQAGDPVLILDDVFAELDARRRARLAEAIGPFEQVLITAAVQDDVPSPLLTHVTRIAAGRIEERNE